MKKIIFLFLSLAIFYLSTSGQAKSSVWAVDFVKSKDREQKNYLQFIEQNWANARAFMKNKGIVASYQFLSIPASNEIQWDTLLLTEYINQEAYEKREAVFNEFRKSSPIILIDGKSSRDMAEIKLSRTFNPPFSPEMGQIMLKTQKDDLEIAAVRTPLENYLQGHATGNGEFMQKAFYPESRLLFVREGKFSERSSAEYIKGFNGKSADDESNRKRSVEVVDVVGNAAIGKIVLDYPAAYFVDYFALLKIDGEWKIVNKSFHAQPRSNPTEKVSFTSSAEEKKAVGIPLENYFKAQATGNGDLIRQAFHTQAKIMFFSDGKFNQWSAEEFAARFSGKPAPDEDKRKRSFEIIDIAGNAAIAKVVLDYPNVKFTDYMTLLKIDGEWKIINKTFTSAPKTAKFVATEAEVNLVRQASLDYVESVYEVNPSKAERSVHPDLVKRGFFVKKNETGYSPHAMNFTELVELAKTYNQKGGVPKDAVKEVVVYDVSDQTASAKVTAVWGIDYLHLAKYDGKWKIINILWQTPPKK